ncbi:MAG: NADH-quinone oxidoreductase subunit I [SAR202 cluster bacterium]|nr:NADH-quinone oxidoreductase subunit I [SAR202 cluster bacterium]
MIAGLKGFLTTIRWVFKRPVTANYPEEHLPVQPRYMGFPALLWDTTADEPFCTGCMVCVRECPTQCMSARMHDNPNFAAGTSHRRKIIEHFEINYNRCILCGICVDVCAFDAIEMTHEHELASYARNGARADLPILLSQGRRWMERSGWRPRNPEKNVAGVALAKRAPATAATKLDTGSGKAPSREDDA